MTYPSGTILTEARQLWKPRITKQQKRARDASAIGDSAPRVEFRQPPLDFSGPNSSPSLRRVGVFGLFFFRVLRLSNFVPLACPEERRPSGALSASRWHSRGRRLSLGLSPLALASLRSVIPPALRNEVTAAEGSLLAGAFLLAFVSFALPSLAVIPSAVEGSAFASQSEISNFQRAVCTAGLRRAVRVPMVFAGPALLPGLCFFRLSVTRLSSRAQSRDLLLPYNLKF